MIRKFLNTRSPYFQCLTTAGLFGIGDTIAQTVYEPHLKGNPQEYDYKRTLRMAAYGCIVAAPAMFTWYKFLDKKIVFIDAPFKTLTARVAADQLLFAPTFLGVFYIYNNLMGGKSWDNTVEGLRKNYAHLLYLNYLIWPAVQYANFFLVPLRYRLLLVNTVAIGWNGILSLKSNQ